MAEGDRGGGGRSSGPPLCQDGTYKLRGVERTSS